RWLGPASGMTPVSSPLAWVLGGALTAGGGGLSAGGKFTTRVCASSGADSDNAASVKNPTSPECKPLFWARHLDFISGSPPWWARDRWVWPGTRNLAA